MAITEPFHFYTVLSIVPILLLASELSFTFTFCVFMKCMWVISKLALNIVVEDTEFFWMKQNCWGDRIEEKFDCDSHFVSRTIRIHTYVKIIEQTKNRIFWIVFIMLTVLSMKEALFLLARIRRLSLSCQELNPLIRN